MGVYEGRGQLGKSLKDLLHRWAEVKGSWEDAQSKQFEEKFLDPIQQDLKQAMAAMDHVAVVIQQVRRDSSE
jgi:hypothetical protein